MADHSRITDILARELQQLCEQGIVISPEILFFAESTHGLGPEDIESALRDPESEAGAQLLALALTPDMRLRRRLEPLLRAAPALGPDDLETLVSSLGQKITMLHLLIPEITGFDLPVGPGDLEYLVAKCYFDRGIDPVLARALDGCLPPATVIACRLLLRCRGEAYGRRKRDFLCRYIEKSRAHEDRFVELFSIELLHVSIKFVTQCGHNNTV